ncbi:hypothetical protein DASC09_058990 [Saccharomycopsis crataegensis]|uniref:chitin synthase n=1 Tax=Saccharomycopsis crataegensis TaxID=43959 RepID=A0AAV5QUC1_9ASCO|nr:hypothetical protein DASC09_058990 [Saccharomycopsis crataegensis]
MSNFNFNSGGGGYNSLAPPRSSNNNTGDDGDDDDGYDNRLPQMPQQTHSMYGADSRIQQYQTQYPEPTTTQESIPMQNIVHHNQSTGRPLPQQPFNSSSGYLNPQPTSLHPANSNTSGYSDPFQNSNPFDEPQSSNINNHNDGNDNDDNDDDPLNHALNMNASSSGYTSSQIPLSMQNTAYDQPMYPDSTGYNNSANLTGYDSPASHSGYVSNNNTGYISNNNNTGGGYLSNNTGGGYHSNASFAVVGDSYMVNPVAPSVALYDNQMNPIRLGIPSNTGGSTTNLFSQGVVLSQHHGMGIGQNEQNQIQGQFEQVQNHQAPASGFTDDPQSQYLLNQSKYDDNDNDDGYGNDNENREDSDNINEDALFFGNLALDCPIPSKLAAHYKIAKDQDRQAAEFMRMKYTAVTSQPERFLFDKFTLRQQLFKTPRVPCEMMIVVTMYNEDDILLGRTLKGIFDNLKYLCRKKKDWGPEGWKKVVVAVVSDGRTKINPRARALMASLGCYQEGFAQSKVLKKDVTCHLYEHTTLANIHSVTDKVNLDYDDIIPVQMIFALKEKNQKKINSHRWCFQALAPALKPDVIVLFDAGTEPTQKSIYKLWREFNQNKNVGGACGEIKAMLGPRGKFLYNGLFSGLLVAGQNFEYKMSNILDKPTESVFGFISVLPGAFSAYRFEALKNDEITGHGPLEAYFKGETLHNSEEKHDLFANNMYLAEDRILCFEIVTKRNSNWVLRYVNTAAAATDVPDTLPEFISQRRRWLNGSFFAAIYSVVHFNKIYRSSHSLPRKVFLQLEFVYNLINIIISWFSVGSFFLVFRILTLGVSAKDGIMYFAPGKVLAIILLWLYIACTMSVFIFAFGNKPKGAKGAYWVVTMVYAVMMGYMIFCAIWMSVKSVKTIIKDATGALTAKDFAENATFRDLVISMCSTYVLYIVSSVMYGEPWHMLTSFIQYLLLSPMYTNILNIYAFCNIHDISWGTKGDDGSGGGAKETKKTEDGKGLVLDIPTTSQEVDDLFDKEEGLINTVPGQESDDTPGGGGDDDDAIAQRERDRKKKLAEQKGDYYQFIRSMVVLIWCITNGGLIALVLNIGGVPTTKEASDKDPTGGTNATTYLTVILWLVASLAGIRFVFSMTYLASRVFKGFR